MLFAEAWTGISKLSVTVLSLAMVKKWDEAMGSENGLYPIYPYLMVN